MTRLPPPEQWALVKMSEMEVAEMIEKHIDFIDPKTGKSVHLRPSFVRHYMNRDDGVLPTGVAVTILPIVLADGGLLAPDGLDRLRGITFEIQREVRAAIPKPKDCTKAAVREAMRYLCDVWLCDVATDFVGKCIIVALALTLIERSLLDERPAFFVTAGRRGGGKTTLVIMLIMAVLGVRPTASAWSNNEEERRKALLSYFSYGMPYILWDNIARGSQITCPHVERSCTAKFYIDRKLGVSEAVATAGSTIHIFTGNNISPRGDLASRSLGIRIIVDRPDPENREFKHADPVGWTENNRAEILRAFYTILLGNPQLKTAHDAPGKTRFKMRWRLVGSAVEHAAKLHVTKPAHQVVDFQEFFLSQEEAEDEDAMSLVDVLDIMAHEWPDGFYAKDVADLITSNKDAFSNQAAIAIREFLYPGSEFGFVAAVRSVGKRLAAHIDEPVKSGERTLILRKKEDTSHGEMKGVMKYHISIDPPAAQQATPKATKQSAGGKGKKRELVYD
jgi:hypothetical protein